MAKTIVNPNQFYFFRRRFSLLLYLVAIIFFIIFFEILSLQIIQGSKYKKLSLTNIEQYIPIPAPRGEIYDRNYSLTSDTKTNLPLVTNEEKIGIYLAPTYLKRSEAIEVLKKVSFLLNLDSNKLIEDFTNRPNYYEPFLIKMGASLNEISILGEQFQNFPGLYWQTLYFRYYPYRNFASHILGFVGAINEEELNNLKNDTSYHLNSIIGKIGVEKYYDKELRGEEGILLRIVDAKNRIKDSKIIREPQAGNIIVLTIDKRIQKILEDVMKGIKGAAIVMDPYSGEILGLVSKPDFDPNIFINNEMDKIIKLSDDPSKPFLNRAIQAKYPTGSIFKIVTATAALEEEIINRTDRFLCRGYFRFPNDERVFHCTGIHGWMNVVSALQFSCNVFFFNVSYELGPKKLLEYAMYYNLGDYSKIDLPFEQKGFLPSSSWKKKVFRESWYDGDTINLGIGQGFLLTTVLQVANIINAIAADGVIYQPHLLKEIYSSSKGELIYQSEKRILKKIPVSEKNIQIIREGLKLVGESGTARVAGRFAKVKFAGKTSTAQNPFGPPHSWFCCFAPYNDESNRITVTVFAENAGGGAEIAAPIAVAILNAIFYNDDPVETKKRIISAVEKDYYYRRSIKMQEKEMMEDKIDHYNIQF